MPVETEMPSSSVHCWNSNTAVRTTAYKTHRMWKQKLWNTYNKMKHCTDYHINKSNLGPPWTDWLTGIEKWMDFNCRLQ